MMRARSTRPAALAVLLLLTSCFHAGTDTLRMKNAADMQSKLHDGQTTEDQVRALFGKPTATERKDDGDNLRYSFSQSHIQPQSVIPGVQMISMGGSASTKTLFLEFDARSVLKNWTFEETNTTNHMGL